MAWSPARRANAGPVGVGQPGDYATTNSNQLRDSTVHLMVYETFANVAADFPRFIDKVHNARRLHSALGHVSPNQFEDNHARPPVRIAA